MPKILVLSDSDIQKSSSLCDELSRRRHQVDVLPLGEKLPEARYEVYSSIILDMRRAQSSGRIVDFCRYLKRSCRKPILVLAENESLDEKIAGLHSGADEYLTEPVDLVELEARLRAVLRRHPPDRVQVLEIADMYLERSACRVRCGLEYIDLYPMEFKLLEFFMKHPNTVFSSEVLHHRLWSADNPQNFDTVRTHIKTLRRKIESGRSETRIETVHGIGYRFFSAPDAALLA